MGECSKLKEKASNRCPKLFTIIFLSLKSAFPFYETAVRSTLAIGSFSTYHAVISFPFISIVYKMKIIDRRGLSSPVI